jgi:hypothetical protein
MRASPDDYKLIIRLMNEASDKLLKQLPINSPSRKKLQEAIVDYIIRVDSSKRILTREQLLGEHNRVVNNIDNAISSTMKGNDADFDTFVKTINPKFVPIAKQGTATPIVRSKVKPVKPKPVKTTKPKVAKTVKPKVVDPKEFNFKNVTEADKDLARQYHSDLGQVEIDDMALEGAMQSDFANNGMKRVDYSKKVNKKKISKEYNYDEDISDEEFDYNYKRSSGSNNADDYDSYNYDEYDNN